MSLVKELKEFLEETYETAFEDGDFIEEWCFYSQGLFDHKDRPIKKLIEKFGSYRFVCADRTDIDKDEVMQVSYFEKYDKYIACCGAYSSEEGTEFDIDNIEELMPQVKTVLKFEKNNDEWCYIYTEVGPRRIRF